MAACEARVQANASSRSRLFLAKTYDAANQMGKAEQQLRLALQQAPDDVTANVALAAVLLRQSQDATKLAEAGRFLAKARALLGEPAETEGDSADRQACLLNTGIYFALAGDLPAARRCGQELLRLNLESKPAKKLLAALGRP